MTIAEPTVAPPMVAGFNRVAHHVLEELEEWGARLQRDAGDTGDSLAVRIDGVRAAGLGYPGAGGTLSVIDGRAMLDALNGERLREWELCDLVSVQALGNWAGVAFVHGGGEMELIVSAQRGRPSWEDAAGWLKIEAAFAAGADRLSDWLADLPQRLAIEPAESIAL